MTLERINKFDQKAFTTQLGDIFEHSPWIPFRTWMKRPFSDLENLHKSLCDTLWAASAEEQMALIRAHHDLAGRLAASGQLTNFSTVEQQSARLDKLTPEQFRKMSELNEAYREKFQFPFIICVKEHGQAGIFEQFASRMKNDAKTEAATALEHICRIAWHRLSNFIT